MRADQRARGLPMRYDGRWRDRDPSEAPAGRAAGDPPEGAADRRPPGSRDMVQGEIEVANEQLDDMVLLRGDGTPTYMLSVVVDDIDMAITHVIRGHDHLTNTFRQVQLYRAIGAEPPRFAHIPLIHGPDGAKLSKRHGALERDRVPRDGLPARGGAQLPAAAGLEPRRRGDHLHRAGGRPVRPRRRSVARRHASTSPSSPA